MEKPTQNVV